MSQVRGSHKIRGLCPALTGADSGQNSMEYWDYSVEIECLKGPQGALFTFAPDNDELRSDKMTIAPRFPHFPIEFPCVHVDFYDIFGRLLRPESIFYWPPLASCHGVGSNSSRLSSRRIVGI